LLALALETSTRRASAALGVLGEKPVAQALLGERPHLSGLLPMVAELFDTLRAAPRDLGAVFVGTGPGSYTGLRVGISTALGLAVGPAPPALYGIASPGALFFGALDEGESGAWITDARSGTWYIARARREAKALQITEAPRLVATADLAVLADERLFTDEASIEALRDLLPAPDALELREPIASDLWQLGAAGLEAGLPPTPPGQLAPLYLREFPAKVRAR